MNQDRDQSESHHWVPLNGKTKIVSMEAQLQISSSLMYFLTVIIQLMSDFFYWPARIPKAWLAFTLNSVLYLTKYQEKKKKMISQCLYIVISTIIYSCTYYKTFDQHISIGIKWQLQLVCRKQCKWCVRTRWVKRNVDDWRSVLLLCSEYYKYFLKWQQRN